MDLFMKACIWPVVLHSFLSLEYFGIQLIFFSLFLDSSQNNFVPAT